MKPTVLVKRITETLKTGLVEIAAAALSLPGVSSRLMVSGLFVYFIINVLLPMLPFLVSTCVTVALSAALVAVNKGIHVSVCVIYSIPRGFLSRHP